MEAEKNPIKTVAMKGASKELPSFRSIPGNSAGDLFGMVIRDPLKG